MSSEKKKSRQGLENCQFGAAVADSCCLPLKADFPFDILQCANAEKEDVLIGHLFQMCYIAALRPVKIQCQFAYVTLTAQITLFPLSSATSHFIIIHVLSSALWPHMFASSAQSV